MRTLLLLMSIVSQAAFALDAATLDNTGFESNIVNVGDLVFVVATSQSRPTVAVEGKGIKSSAEMVQIGDGIYLYEFTPPESGPYLLRLAAGRDTKILNVDVN